MTALFPPQGVLTFRYTVAVVAVLTALLLLVAAVALSIGSVSIPLASVWDTVTGSDSVPETDRTILLAIRLPRVLLAMLVGAGLATAGVVFQALLRNPLAEPYILGISSGGTVGALGALALSAGATVVTVPLGSFLGSALVMFLVYTLAQRRGQLDTFTLLLAGVMIGAFFNAVVLLIISVSHQELRGAFLWLMGNLGAASTESLLVVSPPVLLATATLFAQAKRFNLISTGDDVALHLGVEVTTVKRLSYFLASLITGMVVSVSGVIGFVGLIIPHICRMVFGPDHRLLLPASFLLGSSFVIIADVIARTLLAPTEIPVGAVTAAIGAPVFIYLLRKT